MNPSPLWAQPVRGPSDESNDTALRAAPEGAFICALDNHAYQASFAVRHTKVVHVGHTTPGTAPDTLAESGPSPGRATYRHGSARISDAAPPRPWGSILLTRSRTTAPLGTNRSGVRPRDEAVLAAGGTPRSTEPWTAQSTPPRGGFHALRDEGAVSYFRYRYRYCVYVLRY